MNNKDLKPDTKTLAERRAMAAASARVQESLIADCMEVLERADRALEAAKSIQPQPCACGRPGEPHMEFDGDKITSTRWICPVCWDAEEASNFRGCY
jgi:hypothetical protein